MSTLARVVVERVVRCPFSVAHEYAEDFFAGASRGVDLHVPLRDLGRIRRPVRLIAERRPDEDEPGRQHDQLDIDWSAGTRFFPDFRGTLRLRIESVETTRLSLEGCYQPPFGALGLVFDSLAGRRIARATMSDLLQRVGDALEAREAEFLAGGSSGTSGITA